MQKNGMQIEIEKALIYGNKKKKDIAKYFGITPETFSVRLRTGKFSYDELLKIAELTDCKLNLEFVPQQK